MQLERQLAGLPLPTAVTISYEDAYAAYVDLRSEAMWDWEPPRAGDWLVMSLGPFGSYPNTRVCVEKATEESPLCVTAYCFIEDIDCRVGTCERCRRGIRHG